MKQEFKIFSHEMFGDIRTMTDECGETYFVGKDVAKALGYKNSRDALNKHVDSDDKGVAKCDTLGGAQKFTLINESGLYSLILSSKLPQAKDFKRWVTSEVLPQIRQTGGYIPTHDAEGRTLSEEEIVERAHEIIGNTLQLLNSKSEYCLTATQVAASWGMDVLSFNNLLASMGIQHRKGGHWQLSDELQGRGLTEVRSFFCYSLKGKARMKRYLVWTREGIDFLNMAIRKMPREITANVQLQFNF